MASVSLSSNKSSVCAGGIGSPVHQATITATVKNSQGSGLSGKSVSFVVENADENGAPDEVGSVSASNPTSGSPLTVTTGSGGTATVTFTSSRVIGASNIIKATSEGKEGTTSINMADVNGNPTISRQEMIADGIDNAELRISLSSGGSVEGHSISWRIARVTYVDDDGLTQDASSSEFAAFGNVSPSSSTTNSDGIATSTYTTGTRGGTIYFEAEDTTVSVKAPSGSAGAGSIGSQSAAGKSGIGDIWRRIWPFGKGEPKPKPLTPEQIVKAIKECKNSGSQAQIAACIVKKLGQDYVNNNCHSIVKVIDPGLFPQGVDPCTRTGTTDCQLCAQVEWWCCVLRSKGNSTAFIRCTRTRDEAIPDCAPDDH